jgi:hypothetical protein
MMIIVIKITRKTITMVTIIMTKIKRVNILRIVSIFNNDNGKNEKKNYIIDYD